MATETLSETITVRLSPSEKRQIVDIAKTEARKPAYIARELIKKGLEKTDG